MYGRQITMRTFNAIQMNKFQQMLRGGEQEMSRSDQEGCAVLCNHSLVGVQGTGLGHGYQNSLRKLVRFTELPKTERRYLIIRDRHSTSPVGINIGAFRPSRDDAVISINEIDTRVRNWSTWLGCM